MNNEDKIIETLIEMNAKFDTMQANLNSKPSREEMLSGFDQQQVVLQRLDQERLFTLERIKRIEADVANMKQVLHIN